MEDCKSQIHIYFLTLTYHFSKKGEISIKNKLQTRQQEKKFEQKLEHHMRNIHTDGLKLGANAICAVIMQKIEHCNEKSTKEELLECINNVKEFCKVSIGKNN